LNIKNESPSIYLNYCLNPVDVLDTICSFQTTYLYTWKI